MNSILSILVATALLQLGFSQAWAEDDPLRFNRIHFAETVTQTVHNDQVTVHFIALVQNADPQDVAEHINQKMQQAKRLLAPYPDLRVQTGHYQIQPVYDKAQNIQAWRGQQRLSIQSKPGPGLAKILTKLQGQLNYNGLQFSVSHQQSQKVMAQLLKRGIEAYRNKAKHIAQAFGQTTFYITETRIENPNPPMIYRQPRALGVSAMKAETAPVMEAGQTEMRLTISGEVSVPNNGF